MGAGASSELKITEKDRVKRQNLQNELRKMQNSLYVTSTSHYISAEHYRKWEIKLQYASLFAGTLGATASVASKLAWKMLVSNSPRLAPILVATSTTSLLFTALVNLPQIQNTPANSYQAHFRSGIECQYLERQVKFFTETDVWDSKVAWETLSAKYEKFLRDKKEVNSRIKSENWAYRAALKKIEDREKEKQTKAKSASEESRPVSRD